MQDKLNVIVQKLKNDPKWFDDNGIIVKEKGDYYILNYHQFAPKNEYNVLTRGLVISKNGTIVSCPFFRFFNYGEPTAAQVDFSDSDVLEKLDGSLVGVFFPLGDVENPAWHFRSLLSTHQKDRDFAIKGFVLGDESPLLMEVEPYLKKVNFKKAIGYDIRYFTLVFEFISHANAVITKYEEDQFGLYLIGTRYNPTLHELNEEALDALANTLGVRRPRRWKADSYEEVLSMMANFPKDYEGFVIRDRWTGARIKIKSEDYLRRHRLLTKLNYKNLIPLYFQGERGEIEAYFPQTKQIFDEIQEANETFVQKAVSVLNHWKDKKVSRKDVALGIVGKEQREVCSIVFKLLEQDLNKDEREEAARVFVKNMSATALIEAWSLNEDLVEEVVSEIIA